MFGQKLGWDPLHIERTLRILPVPFLWQALKRVKAVDGFLTEAKNVPKIVSARYPKLHAEAIDRPLTKAVF